MSDKWRNIRDAFSRSLKKQTGESAKKKYLYHDNLLFLLVILEKEETVSSYNDDSQQEENNIEDENIPQEIGNTEKEQMQAKRKEYLPKSTCRKRKIDEVDKALIEALEMTKDPPKPTPNEDESFFASLLLSVTGYSQDEKLQFRIEILQVIQKIKSNRHQLQQPLRTFSTQSTLSTSCYASPEYGYQPPSSIQHTYLPQSSSTESVNQLSYSSYPNN